MHQTDSLFKMILKWKEYFIKDMAPSEPAQSAMNKKRYYLEAFTQMIVIRFPDGKDFVKRKKC